MNVPKTNLKTLLTCAVMLSASAFAVQPVTETIFAESFESPVVEGFVDNSVPDTGWVGSTQGYGATSRGLYNEGDGSVFTTAYGDQTYLLDYTNSGLTTAEGTFPDVLVPDVTYTVSFNTAIRAGETGDHIFSVALVAFDSGAARNDCRSSDPESAVLASVTGQVLASDMSEAASVSFIASETDPNLGRLLAVRLIKSSGDVFYDNVVLTRTYMPTGPSAMVAVPGADNGGCAHDFEITMGEQTVETYAAFLNATDAAGEISVNTGQVMNAATGDIYCATAAAETGSPLDYAEALAAGERFSAVAGKENHPMVFVSWIGAAAYCNWLGTTEGLAPVYNPAAAWTADMTVAGYRLPTEAEWYKATAWDPATQTFFTYGTGSDELQPGDANYLASGDAAENETVGTLAYTGYPAPSSPYGIFDATGNVWEWCQDNYDASGTSRAARGGSWGNLLRDIKTTARTGLKPDMVLNTVGFRVVIPASQP